ncbi:MAG: HAMP domain-containing histidine kinase [Candidatus Latescibacterota bacterium]|nr:MAG: HAMP domain-containing histidine kinase [Candidatus Latescibacterota bacterium]
MWRKNPRSSRDAEPEAGGRLQQLVDAGDTRELARRAMTLQSVLLDLHRQLASVGSQEELARTMALALTGSFGCERLVILRTEVERRAFAPVSQTGDVSEALRVASPELAKELAPVLPHLPLLHPLLPAMTDALADTVQRATRLGVARAAWLNVDRKLDWLVLVGPKLSRREFDEFDRSMLQATFDAASLACSRLLLVDALQRRYQELSEANERLLQIDDLKSAILTGVSHELRSPLTRILSYGEALRDGEVALEQRRAFIDIILNSTRRLASHVDRALSFAELIGGRTNPQPARVGLHQIVEDLVLLHKQAATERGVELGVECNPHVTFTDADYVRVILKNLLDNALKYTPRGGRVLVQLVSEGAGASILVRDNGPGIPEGARERIWRLFELGDITLRRETEGLGLGLALAQRLASELDVELGLAQSGAEGSVFRIHFRDAAATEAEERERAAEAVPVGIRERSRS